MLKCYFNLLYIWDHISQKLDYYFLGFSSHWMMENAMTPYSSTLAWKIPCVEEPGRLQSMGSLRVGHDWATSLSPFTFIHCRRKWQPTPVFLPGEYQGQGSLVGWLLWGRTESDDWSDLAAAAAAVIEWSWIVLPNDCSSDSIISFICAITKKWRDVLKLYLA